MGGASSGQGLAGLGLAVSALLFALSPAGGLLRASCGLRRPDSALLLVLERPG
jgi:hypothetical protein